MDLMIDKVVEEEFTVDNPVVIKKTAFFHDIVKTEDIFRDTLLACKKYPTKAPYVIGPAWYEFSDTMPWVLCTLASKIDNNLIRHYIIQGAYEELGCRNKDFVHSKLFKQSMIVAGLPENSFELYEEQYGSRAAIKYLKKIVTEIKETPEIMGLGLGLELPAIENIDAVFIGLIASNEAISEAVESTKFFKIHRVVEEEHIRLHVSNFLRFCVSEASKSQFMLGFHKGINFWNRFWREVFEFISDGNDKIIMN